MEPNQVLLELRKLKKLAKKMDKKSRDRLNKRPEFRLFSNTIDFFNELDKWLSQGGELPDDWKRK